MYKNAPKKGNVIFCPMCHQFGRKAAGAPIEGKTKETKTPIALCTTCCPRLKKSKRKDLPGQGKLFPE